MRIDRWDVSLALSLALGAISAPAPVLADQDDHQKQERVDRTVDQASADTQTEAERDLVSLARNYRGSAREPELLLRLSELRLEIADTLFRVDYAPGEGSEKKAYIGTIRRSLEPLSRLIEEHSKAAEFPRALFLRGKAHRLLGNAKPALKDFEAFLARYSSREEADLAAIGVADLSIELKNYARVPAVLEPISRNSSSPLYGIALQKRAWSFHAQGMQSRAVSELKRLAKFFKAQSSSGELPRGLAAIRASILDDVPSVAYAAFREDPRRFNLYQADALLKSFDRGAGYRDMAAQFTERLRAADLASEIGTWKRIVLRSDPSKQDNLGPFAGILEYDLGREAYREAIEDARDVARILTAHPKSEDAESARALLVKTADVLTKRIADYKKNSKSSEAEKHLLALFPLIDQSLDKKDFRRIAVRWNLAGTLESLERYDSAASLYRWIEKNWENGGTPVAGVSAQAAGIKAISARYESLRRAGVIPKDLAVKASSRVSIQAAQRQSLMEWIAWVDEAASRADSKTQEQISHFIFEGNRGLYAGGLTELALDRSKRLAADRPGSIVAAPSASLVMDTWIARKNWEKVESLALEFADVKGWKSGDFSKKMLEQASNARLKRAEDAYARKAYAEARNHGNEFVGRYPQSPRAVDAQGIACNSSIRLHEADAALSCLEGVVRMAPGTQVAREALKNAALIEDGRFRFLESARLYMRYLNSPGTKLSQDELTRVRRRILRLTRASGDAEEMRQAASRKSNCTGQLKQECERNLAIASLIGQSESQSAALHSVQKSRSAAPALRAIWATHAIGQWESLSPRSARTVVAALIRHWKDTEASTRYFLIPRLSQKLPEVMKKDRERLRERRLTDNAQSILKRIQALQAWETAAAEIGQLPLSSVQAAVLSQTHGAYEDLVSELKELEAPKGSNEAQKKEHRRLIAKMSEPFVLKARKIRDHWAALERQRSVGMKMEGIAGIWDRKGQTNSAINKEWPKALREKEWSRVAFFAEESSDLRMPGDWVKAARAVSLAHSGAFAEARVVFADACRERGSKSSIGNACREFARSKKGRG